MSHPYPEPFFLHDHNRPAIYRMLEGYSVPNDADGGIVLHLVVERLSSTGEHAEQRYSQFFATASAQWAADKWIENSGLTRIDEREWTRLRDEYSR